jgi:hypothetical protein
MARTATGRCLVTLIHGEYTDRDGDPTHRSGQVPLVAPVLGSGHPLRCGGGVQRAML